eukprot:CAMPEP_0113907258 /NCGR_PEP_ID=MMETSP0780_2-20120614/25356_1 /TAXON_ID=652834 /ORGANISM="Palpitomonas bilix" /LENGTH=163 /DNA_ID=CAMNT_0000902255 /DNA_START=79 /DNA_END=570 /DNA_ORIENTATION=- /assembly_acc=CAM_ASM_000599
MEPLQNAAPRLVQLSTQDYEEEFKKWEHWSKNFPADWPHGGDVYESIRHIRDPEHPYSIEQLGIVRPSCIEIQDLRGMPHIQVTFTPTVSHCTLATTIGLCIRSKLDDEIIGRKKITVLVEPGSHNDFEEVSRRLNDKERVAAAMEKETIYSVIQKCTEDVEE